MYIIKGGLEGEEQLFATLEMEASKHEQDLLAEALLLQEELGVDLAEHVTNIYIFFFFFLLDIKISKLFILRSRNYLFVVLSSLFNL